MSAASVLGVLLMALGAYSDASAPAADEATAAATYDALVSELKGGHTDIDFDKLRESYTHTRQYDPYGQPPAAQAMTQAMEAGDCEKVVTTAQQVLAVDMTDIQAHIFSANCAEKLGDASSEKFQRAVAVGLLRSIARSGAGTTPQSPFVVIAVKEEYAFLYSQGYRVTTQSLVKCGTGECDAMDVTGEKGAKTTFFFDVSTPFAWMAARLSHSEDKPH